MLQTLAAEGLDDSRQVRSPRFLRGPLAGPAQPAWVARAYPAARGPITFRPPWPLRAELGSAGAPILGRPNFLGPCGVGHPRQQQGTELLVPWLAPESGRWLVPVPGHTSWNRELPAGRLAPSWPDQLSAAADLLKPCRRCHSFASYSTQSPASAPAGGPQAVGRGWGCAVSAGQPAPAANLSKHGELKG